ncbi:hypothetical protein WJX73_004476 [Symbiochloris irregularis]|uniref:Uncharacterized protein n=1 Tax=Symbiochloris irregularis TaxID=706552 RepID=A0AAW1P861_9CHLO
MVDAGLRKEIRRMLEVKDQPFDNSLAARSIDEKLARLRNNPAARAELAARVDGYKQQEKDAYKSRAIVKENAEQIGALSTPEAADLRRQQTHLKEQERQLKASAKRQELAQQLLEWRQACLVRDSANRVKRAEAAKEAAEATAIRQKAELATLLVFGASRMQILADTIVRARIQRKRDANMVAGSIVAQKLWRGIVARRKYLRTRAAIITIQRFVRERVWAMRFERRQKASELVHAFILELDRSSAFLRAVKELQHRMEIENRRSLALGQLRKAHFNLVLQQWQNAEEVALEEIKKAAPPKSNFKAPPGDKLKQVQKKAAGPTSQQLRDAEAKATDPIALSNATAVPELVKASVVTAYLSCKRDAFIRAGVARWRATVQYVKWWQPQHQLETARSLVDANFPGFTPFQPPPGVKFRPSAGEAELKAIMQHGVQLVLIQRLARQEDVVSKERAGLEEQLARKLLGAKRISLDDGGLQDNIFNQDAQA